MAYSPRPFDYSLRSHDSTDMTPEGADIFDVRDTQLENYLRTETGLIKAETDTINTNITNLTNTVNGIIPAPGNWDTWSPVLRRGTTTVTTSTTHAYYCYSDRIALFNAEINVSTTTSWLGNQIVNVLLPLTIRAATRVVGHAMFNLPGRLGGLFYTLTAFLPSTEDTNEVRFINHGGQPWFGQTATGNPTLSGDMQGSNLYLNFVCYPAIA